MKKTIILIAMFAVMAAASTVSAKGPQINFDGRNIGVISFMEAVKAIETPNISMVAVSTPTPVKVAVFHAKGEEEELNRSIRSAIKDCDKKGFVALKPKFEKLLAMGTLQEKHDFVYNTNRSYDFPLRFFTGAEKPFVVVVDAENDLRKVNKACLTWERRETCVTGRKEVCHTTCAAATLLCLAVAGVTSPVCTWATPACQIACTFVDDTVCSYDYVCVAEHVPPSCNPSFEACQEEAPRKYSTRD